MVTYSWWRRKDSSSTPMMYKSSRRSGSNRAFTTRSTMVPTVRQLIPINRLVAVLSSAAKATPSAPRTRK